MPLIDVLELLFLLPTHPLSKLTSTIMSVPIFLIFFYPRTTTDDCSQAQKETFWTKDWSICCSHFWSDERLAGMSHPVDEHGSHNRVRWSVSTQDSRATEGFCFDMGLWCFLLKILLRKYSKNPDFDLAGNKLQTSYVRRNLMCPSTPLPRSFTPLSLFLAAEAFEDVPTGVVASENFKDIPQGSCGKSMFFC